MASCKPFPETLVTMLQAPPRSGKTTLAKAMQRYPHYRITYIGEDHFKSNKQQILQALKME